MEHQHWRPELAPRTGAQNWRIEGDTLLIPVCHADARVGQIALRCSGAGPSGTPGLLRTHAARARGTRKRGTWVADVADTLPEPQQTLEQGVMGLDLGVKVPAVVQVIGTGTRFCGNGRAQRACAAGVRSGRNAASSTRVASSSSAPRRSVPSARAKA